MKFLSIVILCLVLSLAAFGQQSVGREALPLVNTYTLEGKPISLNEMSGKVVVMMFWSTKCAICHAEIPKLNKLAAKYAGQEVAFLGITMNSEPVVNDYLRKRPFNFTIIPNGLGVLMQYADKDSAGRMNMGFPSYFIVDQSGRVTQKSDGWDKTAKLDAEIAKLLASGKRD